MMDGYIYNLTDDEGSSFDLEVVGELDYRGEDYVVFLPADMDEDNPDYGFIILHSVEENGEETFESVDDDKLLEELFTMYMSMLEEDVDEEEDAGGGSAGG